MSDRASDLVNTWVTTRHAVVDHAPGKRDLTGRVVRTFDIGRTAYVVIERPDGVQGTARASAVVPA